MGAPLVNSDPPLAEKEGWTGAMKAVVKDE